ncbi:MAG: OsmC family protein [Desulfobaccales bacterium]
MIVSVSSKIPYVTVFGDGKNEAACDTAPDKGGSGAGFRPVDLLEAAFACCLNVTIRKYADKHQIPLSEAKVNVSLHRDDPKQTVFEYTIELKGDLTPGQRQKLMKMEELCAVSQALAKPISFRSSP